MEEIGDTTYTVYIHMNKINYKAYIGITKQEPYKRWKNGKGYLQKYKNTYVQPLMARAILKYPDWDNDWEHIIFENQLSKEQACHMEQLLIALYNTTNRKYGYNISHGGESSSGIVRSEETKKKLRESLKGVMCGDKNPFYGKKHTEETKRKLSELAKKRFETPQNNPMYGKKLSEEQKEQLRKINMERRGNKCYQSIPCYSPELNKQFDCSTEVKRQYGINDAHVRLCYNGQRKHAGRHPETGVLLTWLRLEDAINQGYIKN